MVATDLVTSALLFVFFASPLVLALVCELARVRLLIYGVLGELAATSATLIMEIFLQLAEETVVLRFVDAKFLLRFVDAKFLM